MRRNLVASLFEHETISTTAEKAKEVKSFAEKLITLAKKGTLAARRRAIALLGNRNIVEYEDGKAVKKGTIVGKLFSDLGPRYLGRTGGYTRIVQLSLRRLGDNGRLVLLQLVGEKETAKKESKAGGKKRTRKKAKGKGRAEGATDTGTSPKAGEVAVPERSVQSEERADQAEKAKQPDA